MAKLIWLKITQKDMILTKQYFFRQPVPRNIACWLRKDFLLGLMVFDHNYFKENISIVFISSSSSYSF